MATIATALASNINNKPIIHAYVKRLQCGAFNLYTQTGNALPILQSHHDSYSNAEKAAASLGAVNCRLV